MRPVPASALSSRMNGPTSQTFLSKRTCFEPNFDSKKSSDHFERAGQ